MIVEDNPSLRSMIRSLLELGNAEVSEARDGATVLQAYSSYRPDWVLIDMTLKGSDGLEATSRLKTAFPQANVMLVTDLDSLTLRKKARALGVGGILVKDKLFDELERLNFVPTENMRKEI
jgi:CheY-like chemotaxis protein